MKALVKVLFVLFFFGNSGISQVNSGKMNLPELGLCAHRGDMTRYPENTLISLDKAVRAGAHMVEFDVRLSSDNHLVIIHDDTVDRTTNGSGKVSELSFDVIRSLDAGSWLSDEFKNTRIPTFREVLEIMPVNVWLNIHIKGDPVIGKMVTEEILRQNRVQQSFLACSNDVALAARKVYPKIKICNMDRQASNWDYVNLTIDRESAFIQLKGPVSPEYRELVHALKESGIRINYFGTDDKEKLAQLFEYGVQFPLVNDFSRSIKVAEGLGIARNIPNYLK